MSSRRAFITLLGGAAASAIWPRVTRAQPAKVPTIGFLGALGRITAFVQGLQQLGWTDGRNVRIDARWRDQLRRGNYRHCLPPTWHRSARRGQ